MSKRGVGLLLILTAAIALGALVQDFKFDRMMGAEQASASSFDQSVRDLEHVIDTLDGSRRATLATGQMYADWLDRTSAPIADAEAALAHIRSTAGDAPTIAALDRATAAFAKFKRSDNTGGVQEMHEALADARKATQQRTGGNLSQVGTLRLGMNAVAVIFTLVVAIYLGSVATVIGVKGESSTAQMLRDLPPPVKAGATSTPAAVNVAPAAHPPPPVVPHRPSANLAATAELCVDLAKVLDGDDVPALIERAASVLDARGIVVWAIDADGARLRASLSYGYPDRILAKLRPLQIDADNVTSLAFRSVQPQLLNGELPTDPAALAIPLLTGGGCVGVMSVELRHNRPHADLLPVARILGAQFSTLIAPAEALAQTAVKA